jgi:hypothetical protein
MNMAVYETRTNVGTVCIDYFFSFILPNSYNHAIFDCNVFFYYF